MRYHSLSRESQFIHLLLILISFSKYANSEQYLREKHQQTTLFKGTVYYIWIMETVLNRTQRKVNTLMEAFLAPCPPNLFQSDGSVGDTPSCFKCWANLSNGSNKSSTHGIGRNSSRLISFICKELVLNLFTPMRSGWIDPSSIRSWTLCFNF